MSFNLNNKQYFAFLITSLKYNGCSFEAEAVMIDSSNELNGYRKNIIIPKSEEKQVNLSFMNRLPMFVSFDKETNEPTSFLYIHHHE